MNRKEDEQFFREKREISYDVFSESLNRRGIQGLRDARMHLAAGLPYNQMEQRELFNSLAVVQDEFIPEKARLISALALRNLLANRDELIVQSYCSIWKKHMEDLSEVGKVYDIPQLEVDYKKNAK